MCSSTAFRGCSVPTCLYPLNRRQFPGASSCVTNSRPISSVVIMHRVSKCKGDDFSEPRRDRSKEALLARFVRWWY